MSFLKERQIFQQLMKGYWRQFSTPDHCSISKWNHPLKDCGQKEVSCVNKSYHFTQKTVLYFLITPQSVTLNTLMCYKAHNIWQ